MTTLWKILQESDIPLENATENPSENAAENPRCFLRCCFRLCTISPPTNFYLRSKTVNPRIFLGGEVFTENGEPEKGFDGRRVAISNDSY